MKGLSAAALAVVSRDAPAAVRLAAARGESALAPADCLPVLAVLAADPDPEVRQAARDRLVRGPVAPLLEGLGPDTDPRLLALLASTRGEDPAVADALVRHPAVPDPVLARLAAVAPGRLLAALHDRSLPRPHRARIAAAIGPATRPGSPAGPVPVPAADAPAPGGGAPVGSAGGAPQAPRGDRGAGRHPGESGEAEGPKQSAPDSLPAVPGEAPEAAGETAPPGSDSRREEAGDLPPDDVEFDPILTEESAEELPEGSAKRESIYKQILSMNVAQKIQLAMKGNREARSILVKEMNKQVCGAVIKSPKITETEVIVYASSRNLSDEVFRLIAANKDFTKLYPVRLALVSNPRTPLAIATRFLGTLNDADVEALAKNRNISSAVSAAARRLVAAKQEKQRKREQVGGGH